ncbi:McrC family protein [Pedobacter mucosus]|uniref:McrC family protein n=1 Tax=Pedobacter mucosus TaxID=2895286 RepID=UPI001EE3D83B|nr:McrC family protein [Pedobacter mucosus]UKT65221.1 McrC family protein [Pedobacter mucosus]
MFTIKVFEHQTIKAGEELMFYKGTERKFEKLDEKYINALWKMYDEKKRPFFTPTRGGIKFCEWVGVIKVLDLTLEILPKADKILNFNDENEHNKWQNILVDMLRVCRSLDTPSVSDASLKLKSNAILDLYIERFINEVNFLLHAGFIKKYRKEETNSTALKGRLLLQKHIIKNLVHKELFYISKNTYDKDHILNQILAKAIKILPLICNNQYLISECYQLKLNFPEVRDIKIDSSIFDNLDFDRKSDPYKSAIQIAKLLLLNYRPDVSSGSSHSIAILFDMNKLWEEYIYRMLQQANDGTLVIHSQRSTKFWNHLNTHRYLKPDIVIEKTNDANEKEYVVIDTKWKNIYSQVKNVSMDDLRQMFAYHYYFDAAKCYLLFPGTENLENGNFTNQSYFKKNNLGDKACGIIISKAWVIKEKKGYLNKDIGINILKSLNLLN